MSENPKEKIVSKVHQIKKIDVTIESNGDRYIDVTNQHDELVEMTLPYELTEEFIKDMQVIMDRTHYRNQKAWEAIQKIQNLDEINLGRIAQCLKDVPFESKAKEQLETPKESPKRRIRLKRDFNRLEEHGLKKGAIFETNTVAQDVVCIKTKNGKFVTIKGNDFEEVVDSH